MKKIMALFLVVAMVAAVCAGCSQQIDQAMVGTWKAAMPEGEEAALTVSLQVGSDGTFALTIDAKELMEQVDGIKDKVDNTTDKVVSSVGDIDLEQAASAAGVDISGIQKLLELITANGGKNDGEKKTSATIEGRCKTEDGKMYLSLVKFMGIYTGVYLKYQVTDEGLTLSAPEGDSEIIQMVSAILPVTLEKAE